jgi:light-regulated signal transduction histidine kinase (bacteriophytochrome)
MTARDPIVSLLIREDDAREAERLRTVLQGNGYQVRMVGRDDAAGAAGSEAPALLLGEGAGTGSAADLRRQLAQCSEDLQAITRELESFSYSVSHDLRAPVRAINGFTDILISDHLASLPEEVRHHLLRIQGAAQRLSQLIEDLLQLARINRHGLRRAAVNLTEIAQEIVADLWQKSPQRQVEFRIADDLVVTGDPKLLRSALENLIGNAWKFTGKRLVAHIEVGSEARPDGKVFFVRDNGAGFDMAYVDKLFGVFQRLHGADEFEGNGIGLAIVQRVMARHGGRAWAEGRLDEGATFHFTLPD